MQRFYKFIVVLILVWPSNLFSQANSPKILPTAMGLRINGTKFHLRPLSIPLSIILKDTATLPRFGDRLPSSLPPDFYNKSLAFFCRQELFIEKKFNLPLRFRLGSLDYTNRLEGKK